MSAYRSVNIVRNVIRVSSVALCASLVLGSSLSTAQAMAPAKPRTTGLAGPTSVASSRVVYKHADLAMAIWNRHFSAEDQGDRGTCSVFAVAFLIAFMNPFEHKKQPTAAPEASVEFLNWASNQVTQINEDGSFFDDLANGYIHYGALHESYWRYEGVKEGFNPKRVVSEEERKIALSELKLEPHMIRNNDGTYGLTDAEVQTIKDYLDKGVPVAAGFRISKNMTTVPIKARSCAHCQIGNALAWNTIEDLNDVGGHSMAIVGYQDGPPGPNGGGYFIIRNSWGDADPLYFTQDFVKANVADVIVFTRADTGNGPPLPNKDMNIKVSKAFRLPIASPELVARVSSPSQATVKTKQVSAVQ